MGCQRCRPEKSPRDHPPAMVPSWPPGPYPRASQRPRKGLTTLAQLHHLPASLTCLTLGGRFNHVLDQVSSCVAGQEKSWGVDGSMVGGVGDDGL